MPGAFSVYLDLLRVGAALAVLLSYVWLAFVPQHPLPWPAHQAVVLFFVLSGFVVAYVTAAKEKALSNYAISRAARILSVTLPAIALSTAVACLIGHQPAAVAGATILNFFFIAQSWGLNVLLQANPPYWSLCYEVWYYAIFAATVFPVGWKQKLFWTSVTGAIAGPKILVLMPCWLLGVALYHCAGRMRLGGIAAWLLFAVTILVFGVYFWFDISIAIRNAMTSRFPVAMGSLNGSDQFVGDFLLGLIVSQTFWPSSIFKVSHPVG